MKRPPSSIAPHLICLCSPSKLLSRSLRRSPDKYLEELEREKRRGYQWVPKDVARQGKDLPEWPGSDNPKHTKWDDPPSMYRANTQNSLAFSHEEEASERDYRWSLYLAMPSVFLSHMPFNYRSGCEYKAISSDTLNHAPWQLTSYQKQVGKTLSSKEFQAQHSKFPVQ